MTTQRKSGLTAEKDKAILELVNSAFTASWITPQLVGYVRYRSRKGGILMEDAAEKFGHMRTFVSLDEMKRKGVSVAEFAQFLANWGAKKIAPVRRQRYWSVYD